MLRYEEHRQRPGIALELLQTASLVESRHACTISAIERVSWNYFVLHAMRSACYSHCWTLCLPCQSSRLLRHGRTWPRNTLTPLRESEHFLNSTYRLLKVVISCPRGPKHTKIYECSRYVPQGAFMQVRQDDPIAAIANRVSGTKRLSRHGANGDNRCDIRHQSATSRDA